MSDTPTKPTVDELHRRLCGHPQETLLDRARLAAVKMRFYSLRARDRGEVIKYCAMEECAEILEHQIAEWENSDDEHG